MSRQYVQVGNRSIAFLEAGPPDERANVLVLLHAFPLSASMWSPQLRTSWNGWRVLAPDFRGFGASPLPTPDAAPSIDDYADDVVAMLRELHISRAVVGGVSMGGYVAFGIARRSPDVLRALVLANTRASADTQEAKGQRRSLLALLDREGSSGVAREMLPKLLGPTTRQERPEIEGTVRQLIKQQSAEGIRGAIVRMMERPDSTPLLSQLDVPMLIVAGEEDAIIPVEQTTSMAKAATRAEVTVLERCGHLSNLEQSGQFSAALAGFVARA